MPTYDPAAEIVTTHAQLDALQHRAYCDGGIETLQECLKAVLASRDEYEQKAGVAQDIWDDLFKGQGTMTAASIKLSEAVVMYKARAASDLATSDMIERALKKFTEASAPPLGERQA